MACWKSLFVTALLLSACSPGQAERTTAAHPSGPLPTVSHPYSGFWADDGHCGEEFGLVIAPAGASMYSVSFCGPGGCFEPGTYRPNTRLVGDPDYLLVDADTIRVGVNGGGYQRYDRCPVAPSNSSRPTALRDSA